MPSSFDSWYLLSPLRCRNVIYLIWKAWIVAIEIWNETGKNIPLGGVKLIFLKSIPFHSNGFCTYCDPATPNFISSFNSHYSDLSKEVYNVSVPQGVQQIVAKKLRILLYQSDTFSCQCICYFTGCIILILVSFI